MAKIYNMHKLIKTTSTEFYAKLDEILSGKSKYRTLDGRVLDFGLGKEFTIATLEIIRKTFK